VDGSGLGGEIGVFKACQIRFLICVRIMKGTLTGHCDCLHRQQSTDSLFKREHLSLDINT
jgi:hypothetical protein